MNSFDPRVPPELRELTSYVKDPVFPRAVDVVGLPRVLIVGDSISMYYTPEVRRLLAGRANVHRVPDNGKSTRHGVAHLDAWLGDGRWTVIHCNFGLHDIAQSAPGAPQVPIDEYRVNLIQLLERMQATGAQLVLATTTPVPEGTRNRSEADAVAYNTTALQVAQEARIAVNDLHAFISGRQDVERLQLLANVHFRAEGSVELAARVAAAIVELLPSPR